MQVTLREINWTDLWIWFAFEEAIAERQRLYLDQVLDAWYSVGLLGGYNASRLPLHDAADEANFAYTTFDLEAEPALPSLMHNMGEVEYELDTARCWFDLGTADPLALDILLNALQTLSQEYLPIKHVVIGGSEESSPWEVDEEEQ